MYHCTELYVLKSIHEEEPALFIHLLIRFLLQSIDSNTLVRCNLLLWPTGITSCTTNYCTVLHGHVTFCMLYVLFKGKLCNAHLFSAVSLTPLLAMCIVYNKADETSISRAEHDITYQMQCYHVYICVVSSVGNRALWVVASCVLVRRNKSWQRASILPGNKFHLIYSTITITPKPSN